ncbi:uncharacterized protein LOC118754391 [Rhagoletis pomonella]|uniref:uncharacterized protein LOC118754391 n=1 Tax=Rhagoletis pomonella TaxID=28610 RepID=UPI001782B8AB|nr:uncharacterized protein LOC118754391 [Rhagoletis pomonella]
MNWGDSIITPKGNALSRELSNTSLICLNNGTKTHYCSNSNSNAGSVLDLTFSTIAPSNINWQCQQVSIGGSRHYLIIIEIKQIQKLPNFFVPKRKFIEKLATVEFSNLDNLQKDIQAARNKVKIDLNKSGHKPKAWWNEEINKLYRLQLAKRKKANTTNAVVDFEIALRAKEEWKQAVKEAKNKNYKERIEELNNCPNTKDAWRFISNVKGNKHKNGDWATEDNLEYLEMLKSQVTAATIQATQPGTTL